MRWKRLFYLLLGINGAVLIVIFVFGALLFSRSAEDVMPPKQTLDQNDVYFQVRTNKQDLNKVINHYLEEELSGKIDYKLILTDEVELYGSLPVFSSEVEMKMTFEPHALENGDIELEQKTMSIGKLSLPVPLVLEFIKDSYEVPEWVVIQPDKEKIYLSLQNMKLKSNFKVRVEEFQLKNDDILFSLRVPMNESMNR
ncbi:YpmS family protein [Niallia oryzisoli]|uniref:YpmS family protein n=1 Tax=Niallia oryzisoli TaxID=1737571 RepID=A0ABZ2CKT2_9BACI